MADFCDLAWEHILSIGVGGMGNPMEFRELMKAHMRYNETRTVDEVIEEQSARHKRGHKGGGTRADPNAPTTAISDIPKSEIARLQQMLAAGAPPAPPTPE